MSREPTESDRSIDAYLDGGMSAEHRAVFEREMDADPARAGTAALQGRIDDALRRQFKASAFSAPPLPDAEGPPVALRSRAGGWRRPGAIAAAVLLSAAGLWSFFVLSGSSESLVTIYAQQIDNGFVPGWVCETDEEFAKTFGGTFQQPLLLAAAPGVEALGLSYNVALGSRTVMLLARVDGEPVLVFAGSTGFYDVAPPAGNNRRLNVFERQIGLVKLFEVTPFETPRLLPDLYAVDDGGA